MTARAHRNRHDVEPVSLMNRVAGSLLAILGLLFAVLSAAVFGVDHHPSSRPAVAAFGGVGLVLLVAGATIGFRDFLTKNVTALGMIFLGVFIGLAGVAILAGALPLLAESKAGLPPRMTGVLVLTVGGGLIVRGRKIM